jgi:hypothetical protein
MRVLRALILLPLTVVAQNGATTRARTQTGTGVCTATAALAEPSTTTYLPILSIHAGDECPQSALLNVHYHDEEGVGCCTQSATLTEPGGTAACCPCGAACTGTVPSMLDWTFSAGQFVTAAIPQTGAGVTTTPTVSPTSGGTPQAAAAARTNAFGSFDLGLGFFAAIAGAALGGFALLV